MRRILPHLLLACSLAAGLARAEVTVVEYRHAGFDHYFVTPVPAEIVALDARVPPFELWSRTGRTFRAYDASAAPAGAVPICRFFNDSFAPKSSHFYAARGLGCEQTLAQYPDWRLEDDRLFAVLLPDAAGACPAGTQAVYRLYNDGRTGAPNHRFVTGLADRQAMIDQGYVPEGAGIGVGMCVPAQSAGPATAVGLWRGVTASGRPAWVVVHTDAGYYLVHGDLDPKVGIGVVTGTLAYTGTAFASTEPFYADLSSVLAGSGAPVQGTFSAGSLRINVGTDELTATYDPAYDEPADVASLAGTYTGASGHQANRLGPPGTTKTSIDAQGNIVVNGANCTTTGQLVRSTTAGGFEVALTGAGSCVFLTSLRAFVVYDAATRRIAVLSTVFRNFLYGGADDVYVMFGTRD